MELKSLEIKGFKSFANSTVINFNEDVTGVVGPNGSGKSNIVDSIRWVLGEQKGKNLRLDNRSDVIFNGSKDKKAAGVAQVSITFTNTKNILPTEYNEVKISRLQYRNGDSEYRLNGVKCRLKDINNLLVDTGIGSNSYAIIALGMVEDILKNKDNARRKMFEQVSGISKFKKRKIETLNKLNQTTEDLDRVEDLLHEIEANMKSLEKQAKRTEQYFVHKENYKADSIKYSVLSIADLKEKHEKYKNNISKAEDDYRGLEIEITKLEAEVQEHKKNQLSEEQNLSVQQKGVNDLVSRIRECEAQKELLKQQIEFAARSLENNQNVINRNAPILKELKEEINSKKEESAQLINQLASIEKDYVSFEQNHKKAELEYKESKSKFDVLTEKRQSLEQSSFEKAKELAIQNNRISAVENELAQIKIEIQSKQEQLNGIDKVLKTVQKDFDELSKKIEELEVKRNKASEKSQELNQKIEKRQTELIQVNRSLDSKTNEHTLLKSMIENLEGFPESIKFLSKNWNKSIPILSDILDVEAEFKGVIEHFLEPYLNYYLVENVGQAAKAIELLSKSQKGKAQFFLLDKIPAVAKSDSKDAAISLVTTDKKYQALLNYLLDNVFVTDKDVSSLNDDKIYLSIRGDFVKRINTLSGGSVGLFEGKKIGRKKELEKLTKHIEKLEKEKSSLEKNLEKLNKELSFNQEHSFENEISDLKTESGLLNNQLVELKTKKESLSTSVEELNAKQSNAKNDLKINTEGAIVLDKDLKNIQKAMSAKEVLKSNPDQLDLLAQNLTEEAKKFSAKNIELIQKKSEHENLLSDLEFSERRLKELNERISESKSSLDENSRETQKVSKDIAELESQLEELYKKRDEAKSALSEIEQEFFSKRNSIAEKEESLRGQNRTLQKTQLFINETKDKFNDVKFQMGAVGERLKIEFEVELEEVLKLNFEEENLRELKSHVENLRRKIANFGEINPMAVEAFNTMKERHTLISGQRNDILEAKDSLMETISEIEGTATQLFKDTFYKVRENFVQVFRSLFSEDDSCDLVMEDEENPLDSSIEIIAKPKGKRPLSLSQLSGGEMTLTATALLFAFYLQKPAPFCIFDEVDAPLDDVNVLKFNKIIKKFSKDSQFVIVTHNKATMAEVDVLYGVYMQDMGISSVSPVDFRSFGHNPILNQVN